MVYDIQKHFSFGLCLPSKEKHKHSVSSVSILGRHKSGYAPTLVDPQKEQLHHSARPNCIARSVT